MFEEAEWAEAAPVIAGLGPVTSRPPPPTTSRIKGSKHRQLLATLRALEAASLPQHSPSLHSSDSEEEEVERKKKRPQKASFASASAAVEKRKKKCQKHGPPCNDSEEEGVERKKRCRKWALLGSNSAEEEKRKRKCQKHSPSSQVQHLDNVDQTGPKSWKSSAADDSSKPNPGSTFPKHPNTLNRKQWRNRQKNKRRHKNKFRQPQVPDPAPVKGPTEETEVPPDPRLDSHEARAGALRARMAKRLDGARFRYLNEQLYSGPSSAAQRLFQEDPEAFLLYHRGFQSQIKKWPLQPVDRIARDLRQRPASLVVADFGCGDCHLASSIRNPVHCFDLASLDPRVTVCDMAQVPLEDESVDVAVFCLSLMGTNIRDFLEEANRVLKPGGLLKVAEVSSRFEDVRTFLGAVTKLGFKVISKDLTNSHFFLFDFQKTGPPRVGPKAQLSGLKLQPCLYKRR
ncbi:ribosomal RNA-processing protein 8 [Carlito syrichta]|uniref:Ribosomal RNA-processing protein 8 n=1 Tax=Carlito syrichta TaxID=1868482 RepID=A0A1U7TJC8_CARSF|nr:ribosomal RNA-processing protein 8 [Carlito syrichta]XP_021566865.1 ribosomal RNA-processing protein 8 [Carlito syrichta]XP_021566866.1 ribosomal RNA-processing protein 8 [Carlito syrichta]XP_021566867.1 ribosomal RNA-processing protein 8 [Carlito syrichta]